MGNRLIGSVGLSVAGGTPSPYTRTTSFVIACGAEDEALTTAGTGANLVTLMFEQNGTDILSTAITIDASELTSTTSATPPVISTSALTDDASIDCDVDQIDSGGASKGLKMYLIGYKTL